MGIYEKAVKVIEEYLSQLAEVDVTEHHRKGQYRVVINNWEGRCESTIVIGIDPATERVTYKMYYGARVVTEEQKMTLTEYFSRTIRERCLGGVDDNGAVFIKVEHSCILYGLCCEDLQTMQKTCTERICSDKYYIKKFING